MVRERKDWCISRQRKWGVPIPIFFCKECGEPVMEKSVMLHIAKLFGEHGSDIWYEKDASELIPDGLACSKCGCKEFNKEKDIMDVWFDSGVSHIAVCESRPYLKWPADLYLEGADQYRGWFQSSLLTSVAARGQAPYKSVVTHGWVVDMEKKKMSKSAGNGMSPAEIIDKYGADILRLWVSSTDYHADVRISKEILAQLSEAYRKIRNTARYILGNLKDFDPDKDMVSDDKLLSIDKWALMKLDELNDKVRKAYDCFDFHIVYQALHNFCVVDMSNFYFDVLKDRLYTEQPDGELRRAAQTTIYRILDAMTRLVSPILVYTTDEIWQYMPHDNSANAENVLFNNMPEKTGVTLDESFVTMWDRIHETRDTVKKAIEIEVKNKTIRSSLEAKVTLKCSGEQYDFLKSAESELAAAFIVSDVEISEGSDELNVEVTHAEGEKCERCWIFSKTVGTDADHPTLCKRCASVISSMGDLLDT